MDPETPAPETPIPPTTTETPSDPPSLISEATAPAPETTEEAKAPEEPKVPEQQEFQFDAEKFVLPEGMTIAEEVKTEFIDLAKQLKISPENATELAKFQAKLAQSQAEETVKVWTETQTKWREEVQKHPEFGGDKLPAVLNDIGKIVDQYGSPEFREVMTLTGAGNHPAVVAFFHKIAKDLVEPAPVTGAPVSAPKSLAEGLFTTMNKG